jgi:hypothetical protein
MLRPILARQLAPFSSHYCLRRVGDAHARAMAGISSKLHAALAAKIAAQSMLWSQLPERISRRQQPAP